MAWTQPLIFCTTLQLNNAKKDARHRARLRLRGLRTTRSVTLSENHPIERIHVPAPFECALVKTFSKKRAHLFLVNDLYLFQIPINFKTNFV